MTWCALQALQTNKPLSRYLALPPLLSRLSLSAEVRVQA
jgi:hypothetical protein